MMWNPLLWDHSAEGRTPIEGSILRAVEGNIVSEAEKRGIVLIHVTHFSGIPQELDNSNY